MGAREPWERGSHGSEGTMEGREPWERGSHMGAREPRERGSHLTRGQPRAFGERLHQITRFITYGRKPIVLTLCSRLWTTIYVLGELRVEYVVRSLTIRSTIYDTYYK